LACVVAEVGVGLDACASDQFVSKLGGVVVVGDRELVLAVVEVGDEVLGGVLLLLIRELVEGGDAGWVR
jgi:hypothetical protein